MDFKDVKYRAWVKEDEKIYPVDDLEFDSWNNKGLIFVTVLKDEPCCMGDKSYYEYKPEDVELMAYTGFTDKEGVEIYEGDIIKVGEDEIYVVQWDNETASFRLNDENNKVPVQGMMFNKRFLKHYKVIGNVFEEPHELLK